ncbi:MAG: hypothetical protein ACLPWF_31325 [Bryobacteraceae bacterium]
MDLIFTPKSIGIGSTGFVLTVRLVPAFKPESQVNLVLLQDGTMNAEFAITGHNVWYHSSDLLNTGVGNHPDTLAKKTVVKRYPVNVSMTLLAEWQRGFIEGLNPTFRTLDSLPLTVTLDGDRYEVSYERGQTNLRIIMDPGTPSPLLNWAKTVHGAVEKMALQSN